MPIHRRRLREESTAASASPVVIGSAARCGPRADSVYNSDGSPEGLRYRRAALPQAARRRG
jgi:hypothetical protein